MTATSARVSAGSAGWSVPANSAAGPEDAPGVGAVGCCFCGPGQRAREVGRGRLGLAEHLHVELDGQLGRDVRGDRAESAAFSETYHSPGAGNLSLS